MDCVDDEWIGNRRGWGREVVRGKRYRDGNMCEVYVIPLLVWVIFHSLPSLH